MAPGEVFSQKTRLQFSKNWLRAEVEGVKRKPEVVASYQSSRPVSPMEAGAVSSQRAIGISLQICNHQSAISYQLLAKSYQQGPSLGSS
jgi:hypothetical protein